MVFNATKWSNDSNDWMILGYHDFGNRHDFGESQPLPRAPCRVPLGRSTWVKNSDFLPSARYRGSKPKVPVDAMEDQDGRNVPSCLVVRQLVVGSKNSARRES